MEWIIKLENKPNLRIRVVFMPMNEALVFYGQYKPYNKEWVNFSEDDCNMNVDLETIQNTIKKVYDSMKERLDAYENISEGFSSIKLIEIKED